MVKKHRPREISVSSPADLQHGLHIDHNFGWHVNNPALSIKIDEKIGESSVGLVYKAMLLGLQFHFAVQIVEGDWEANEMEHLQHEISIWQRLHHPNIVSYFGSYATTSNLWILMDYCRLGSIQDMMQICSRTLLEKEIACICAATLRALDFLHTQKKPIIHRDIKSASIHLMENGEIKLGNFGISQRSFDTDGECIAGTPHFMAPEVVIGGNSKYEPKADIWSLGITAIEMADGSPKYWDINRSKLKRKATPNLLAPHQWSHEFNDFVRRCLLKDVNARPSAEMLLQHPFILGAKEGGLKKLCQQVLKAKNKKGLLPCTY